jgi:putative DNA primase/helicase
MSAHLMSVPLPINTTPNSDNVPKALQNIPQWANFLPKWQPEKGKYSKPPKQPNGSPASSTNSQTWSSFDTVVAASKQSSHFGIGFMVTEKNGITGIDLDHCRDPATGKTQPWARQIIEAINSYTEVSPSGTGYRILLYGTIPASVLDKGKQGRKKGNIEVYHGKRFLTVTGDHVPGTPRDLEHQQEALEAFCEKHLSNSRKQAYTADTCSAADRDAVSAKAEALCASNSAFKALWDRARDDFEDQSASTYDLALANFAVRQGLSDSEIIMLLRLWREQYDENTAKLERRDYIDNTLGKARSASKPQETIEYRLDDIGNGERFADQHGENARYIPEEKCWCVWKGKRWVRDMCGEAELLAEQTARSVYNEAKEATSVDESLALAKHAHRSAATPRLEAMVKRARPRCRLPAKALNANPMLLGVENGVLDLKTGTLREAARDDFITLCAGVAFDPETTCPEWMASLAFFSGNDAEWVAYLQRLSGYLLTGRVGERGIYLLHGSGDNFKSTYLRTMQTLLGDYSVVLDTEFLLSGRREGPSPSQKARLKGARMATASEIGQTQEWNAPLIKHLTGGDALEARDLYARAFQFTPECKLLVATNEMPRLAGYRGDEAFLGRLNVIPFPVSMPRGEQDGEFFAKRLLSELPGILNWCLAGCLAWQRDGLSPPDSVHEATERYREGMAPAEPIDGVTRWYKEVCRRTPGTATPFADLYRSYRSWVLGGEGGHLRSERGFALTLEKLGVVRARRRDGSYYLDISVEQRDGQY